uniref:Transposase Helix-turn-helix domain-containing protein n=1 Tax=Knipowitschia caucasica TaxID=637954 RepID=A0AAV2MDI1_KNICA
MAGILPDWAPSLNLGHSEIKPTRTGRYGRKKRRRRRVAVKTPIQKFYAPSPDHNYCVRQSSTLAAAELQTELKRMKASLLYSHFYLQRFAGSDEDIHFFTRFSSYRHLQNFWRFINSTETRLIQETYSLTSAANLSTKLPHIDELFMFLMYLSVGLHPDDLSKRFGVSQAAVNRVLTVWTHLLYQLLGSTPLWMAQDDFPFALRRRTSSLLDLSGQAPAHGPACPLLHVPGLGPCGVSLSPERRANAGARSSPLQRPVQTPQDEESEINWAPLDLPPVPAEWGDCEVGEALEDGSLLTLDEVPDQVVEDFTSVGATTRRRRRKQPTLCPRMDLILHYATREWPKPLAAKRPALGYGMYCSVQDWSWAGGVPDIEDSVRMALLPSASVWPGARPLFPSERDRMSLAMLDRCYANAAQVVALANNMAFTTGALDRPLTTGQALSGDLLTEARTTSAALLRMSQAFAVDGGRTMAAAQVGARHLWLGLANIREAEKRKL